MNDLLAEQVDLFVVPLSISISLIQAGKLKLLASTGHTRLQTFSNVPALAELVPGLEAEAWTAIAAPPGTPKSITGTLSNAVAKVVEMPDVKGRFSDLQVEPLGTSPEGMREMIRRDTEQWGRVIAAAKISMD